MHLLYNVRITDNAGQNIWRKIKKLSKVTFEEKKLISVFVYILCAVYICVYVFFA